MLPSTSEINSHILFKLLARKTKLLLNNFSSGFLSTVFVHPVLRVLLDLIVVHVAAAAVASAIFRQLPEVVFGGVRWLEAAVAVAPAVDLNVHTGGR